MTVASTLACAADALVPLPWDSAHFGLRVARLTSPDPRTTRQALESARRSGTQLVYWQVEPTQPVPEGLLAEFGGRLVDRKATYQADLSAVELPGSREMPDGIRVREWPEGQASAELCALAVQAGACSRFRTDPGIPEEKYVGLYTTWIERSVRRELADVVLVAERPGDGRLLGVVTAGAEGDAAQIGLIAVADGERGRGVGRLLLWAAHRWMTGRGCVRAMVVTQLANTPACRLFERAGYQLHEVKHCYHFWLSEVQK